MQFMVKKLAPNSKYNYQILISKNEEINAFALPGGIIVVNAGMLKVIQHPEELAALLAHEIQHIEQRHALNGMISKLGLGAILAVVLGDFSTVALLATHQIGSLYLNRELEEEADIFGVQMLQKAKIHAKYMISLFEKLEKGNVTNISIPAWLSTHQQINERIKIISNYIANSPCNDCQQLNMTMASFKY